MKKKPKPEINPHVLAWKEKMKKKPKPEINHHVLAWKEMVYDRDDVDPDSEYIWEGVAVGFFVARGLTPDEARDLYNTQCCDLGYG